MFFFLKKQASGKIKDKYFDPTRNYLKLLKLIIIYEPKSIHQNIIKYVKIYLKSC